MKLGPLHPATTLSLDPSERAQAKVRPGQVDEKAAIDPEKLRLAREFEQIFIRKMLSSLEKSGQKQAGASVSAGGDAYGSMVVSALAEAVSKGGGIGLAEVIARAASQPVGIAPTSGAPSTPAIQAPPPSTATYPRPAAARIINENHDIQDPFKNPNR